MCPIEEINAYRTFTGPAEMNKSINSLIGLLRGVAADCMIDNLERNELLNWYSLHRPLINKHPYSEILPAIDAALADNILEAEEADNLAWLCEQLSSSGYYDLVTSSIQQLHGIIHGIMANGTLTDSEIIQLLAWMDEHDFLQGTYPFNEIQSTLSTVMADGIITDDERNYLKAFFSEFIDTKESATLHAPTMEKLREDYSIKGVCAVNPRILIQDHTFCFTGTSSQGTRAEIAEIVTSQGGKFTNTVGKKTDYLIVGIDGNPCWAYSCYGRKVETAVSLQREGAKIVILNETDFWPVVSGVMTHA